MIKRKLFLPLSLLSFAFIAPVLADEPEKSETAEKVDAAKKVAETKEAPATKPSPYTKPNNSWITISGKVTDANVKAFVLDYGRGSVVVEMDGWKWYVEGHNILKGDSVTVTGKVDRDKGELTSIEAQSVFVKGISTYFYASPVDEEGYEPTFLAVTSDAEQMEMQGTVSKVNGREFTLEYGKGKMIVDTDEMENNPMDDEGSQKIRVGDVVRVYGKLDKDLLEADEIKAKTIITIVRN